MKMPVVLGDRLYTTKKAVTADCRKILSAARAPTKLKGKSQRFVSDVLAHHPQLLDKVGAGLAGIVVAPSQHPRNTARLNCFWALRRDGSLIDWSYRKCITPPSKRTEVLDALRTEIRPQIEDFRAQSAATVCAISGAPLAGSAVHVDHARPFVLVALDWLSSQGLVVDALAIVKGQWQATLADRALAESWQAYHKAAAKLRLVTATSNLTRQRPWIKGVKHDTV